jgi:tetratricopeptide (TPR) repeat protein
MIQNESVAKRTAKASGNAETRFRRALWAVVGAAGVLRLVHAVSLSGSPIGGILVGDARSYDAWARALAAGDWLGTEVFYQAPLYPYFLGIVYALFEPSPAAARLAQACVGAAACGILTLAGRAWFGPRAGVAAGVLAAVYAPAVFFDGLIQKSTLDFVLASLLLWTLGRARGGTGLAWPAASGAVLGAFSLTRENALLLAPWIALWFLLPTGVAKRGVSFARASVFATAFVAILLPVGIRNAVVGGEFLLTTMQSGTNLWFGNNPDATGRHEPLREGREMPEFERADATAIAEAAVGRKLGAREVSVWWRDRALAWIRENPVDWLRLTARKILLIWNRVELPDTESLQLHADHSPVLRVLAHVPAFGLLAPLAAAGAVLTRRRWRELWPLYGIVLVFTGAVALFYVFARYRFPLVPPLLLFAGAAWTEGLAALRSRARRETAVAAAAAAGFAWVVWAPVAPTTDPRPLDWANLASAEADAGRWDEAIAWLRRSASAAPREPRVRYGLGRALEAKGRTVEAEAEYRAALGLDPSYAGARTALGILLAGRGEWALARRELETVLRDDPESALAWNNLANLDLLEGRPDDAVAGYREALARDPGWLDARVNLARALLESGSRDEARGELRAVLARDPAREDALRLLAEAQ